MPVTIETKLSEISEIVETYLTDDAKSRLNKLLYDQCKSLEIGPLVGRAKYEAVFRDKEWSKRHDRSLKQKPIGKSIVCSCWGGDCTRNRDLVDVASVNHLSCNVLHQNTIPWSTCYLILPHVVDWPKFSVSVSENCFNFLCWSLERYFLGQRAVVFLFFSRQYWVCVRALLLNLQI